MVDCAHHRPTDSRHILKPPLAEGVMFGGHTGNFDVTYSFTMDVCKTLKNRKFGTSNFDNIAAAAPF